MDIQDFCWQRGYTRPPKGKAKSFIHTLHVTSHDVAGGQEHNSPATKPSNLMKDPPGRRQFYRMTV